MAVSKIEAEDVSPALSDRCEGQIEQISIEHFAMARNISSSRKTRRSSADPEFEGMGAQSEIVEMSYRETYCYWFTNRCPPTVSPGPSRYKKGTNNALSAHSNRVTQGGSLISSAFSPLAPTPATKAVISKLQHAKS